MLFVSSKTVGESPVHFSRKGLTNILILVLHNMCRTIKTQEDYVIYTEKVLKLHGLKNKYNMVLFLLSPLKHSFCILKKALD
jgi:hypothetical protein